MNLEEVIPALRDGKIITRAKSFVSHDVLPVTIFVKMVDKMFVCVLKRMQHYNYQLNL